MRCEWANPWDIGKHRYLVFKGILTYSSCQIILYSIFHRYWMPHICELITPWHQSHPFEFSKLNIRRSVYSQIRGQGDWFGYAEEFLFWGSYCNGTIRLRTIMMAPALMSKSQLHPTLEIRRRFAHGHLGGRHAWAIGCRTFRKHWENGKNGTNPCEKQDERRMMRACQMGKGKKESNVSTKGKRKCGFAST
jgi:hypothetical protein